MEYVRVICQASADAPEGSDEVAARDVLVDGNPGGQTGQVLAVEAGFHRFTLGDGNPYAPRFRRPNVHDTSALDPLEVTFWET